MRGILRANGALAAVFATEQRNKLPQRGEADERVNDPAKQAHFAEDRGNQVEVEQADEGPS